MASFERSEVQILMVNNLIHSFMTSEFPSINAVTSQHQAQRRYRTVCCSEVVTIDFDGLEHERLNPSFRFDQCTPLYPL